MPVSELSSLLLLVLQLELVSSVSSLQQSSSSSSSSSLDSSLLSSSSSSSSAALLLPSELSSSDDSWASPSVVRYTVAASPLMFRANPLLPFWLALVSEDPLNIISLLSSSTRYCCVSDNRVVPRCISIWELTGG
uniref:Putative secreted protein n=1 Tax=Anopheles marajoara TaxID=58244 RepID=A0A2M4C6S9_9DIPT